MMSEFKKIYGDNFFLIDSNNLENISSKLYGYAISDNEIIFEGDNKKNLKLDGNGSYINIIRDEELGKVYISQDFTGSYGLYYYIDENTGYFAFSNSFLKLVEFLKEKQELYLNKDYILSYISTNFCSLVYKQTPIIGIQSVPPHNFVSIDISKKKFKFFEIDYNENSISINSAEALVILDNWFYKWVNFFKKLFKNNENIKLNLSGGFDSRVLLVLALYSFNLNKIDVVSYANTGNIVFDEDYEIASLIAKDFGFKLNNNFINLEKEYFQELETSLNCSFYTKLGFSKQMYWNNGKFKNRIFSLQGFGAELSKNFYKTPTVEHFINFCKINSSKYSVECAIATNNMLKQNFEEFKLFNASNIDDLLYMQYKYSRNIYHFGKTIVERYLSNDISISPFLDPLLNKINTNEFPQFSNLLHCLILSRYCPKLLNYDFEGGRNFQAETLNFAKKISALRPFDSSILDRYSEENVDYKSEIKFEKGVTQLNKPIIGQNMQNIFLKKIFLSESFKNLFSVYFSEDIYNIMKADENESEFNDSETIPMAIGMIYMMESVKYSQLKFKKSCYEWMDKMEDIDVGCIKNNHFNKN